MVQGQESRYIYICIYICIYIYKYRGICMVIIQQGVQQKEMTSTKVARIKWHSGASTAWFQFTLTLPEGDSKDSTDLEKWAEVP